MHVHAHSFRPRRFLIVGGRAYVVSRHAGAQQEVSLGFDHEENGGNSRTGEFVLNLWTDADADADADAHAAAANFSHS